MAQSASKSRVRSNGPKKGGAGPLDFNPGTDTSNERFQPAYSETQGGVTISYPWKPVKGHDNTGY